MDFEIFRRNDRRKRGIYICVNKSGMLSLSREAWEALGSPGSRHEGNHVELLFARDQHLCGIRVAPPTENTFAVSGRKIHAKSFLAHVGLWPDKGGVQFEARMSGDTLLFGAALPAPEGTENE